MTSGASTRKDAGAGVRRHGRARARVFRTDIFSAGRPAKTAAEEAYPWPIEPGTDFVVQMHLKPSGRPEDVQASIGLYLTDEAAGDRRR